ncbi:MAG: carbohydrate-binding protein, partial [Fibrobacter sp.]|nr:carbohydrate-binding protein [Fibrobacter sp.]
PEIQAAVKGAIAWYKKNKLSNKAFSKTAGVVDKEGSSLWFRFYEVNSDDYFFCDRGGESTKTQNFMAISEERRTGYQWAGDYGSAILSAEQPYLTALEKMDGTYVEPPPPAAMCGNDTCKAFIDGVDFIDIKGVKEATNAGFIGEGYANVDNEAGSYVTYGVTALSEGKYTLFISFANGSEARDYKISIGDKVLLESGTMEGTGAWTTYKTQSVEIELPKGYNEITFTSLGSKGMANIDMIGWMSENLKAGKVEITETPEENSGDEQALTNGKFSRTGKFHKAYSGNYGKGAGVFYFLNGKKDLFRANGKRLQAK